MSTSVVALGNITGPLRAWLSLVCRGRMPPPRRIQDGSLLLADWDAEPEMTESPPPRVDFKDRQLSIAHQGMTWRVEVEEAARAVDPGRPLVASRESMTSFSALARSSSRIGFIGFGEVAGIFSEALQGKADQLLAYDVLTEQPGVMARLAQRAGSDRVRFVSLADLVSGSDWIFSTVTTTVAESVARSAAPYLSPGKSYLDLNATSPALKQGVAAIIDSAGGHFVEGAILTAVGVTGTRTRILIGDTAGPASADVLSRLGLNASHYSREIGKASAFKLLRSIFSKGIEALLIEFLVAGRRAGLQEDLWREVVDLFAQNGFEKVAENWIRTHARAHERRQHEVVQVIEELRALGIEPLMTTATEAVFSRSLAAGLKTRFATTLPTLDAVIGALEEASRPPLQSSNSE
jgi:3-hydroxyisobutyrate dehydrogenase-like beta-hydroxyacid dehydrogenase